MVNRLLGLNSVDTSCRRLPLNYHDGRIHGAVSCSFLWILSWVTCQKIIKWHFLSTKMSVVYMILYVFRAHLGFTSYVRVIAEIWFVLIPFTEYLHHAKTKHVGPHFAPLVRLTAIRMLLHDGMEIKGVENFRWKTYLNEIRKKNRIVRKHQYPRYRPLLLVTLRKHSCVIR